MTAAGDTGTETAVSPARRPYETPSLTHHGSVAVQTADNSGPPTTDANFFSNVS
ncbi:hypothetical protein [Frankia sp. QA3]|uniref:hypothetical protein n=1 Tax=Frankia sp. QA3 TaxID=710111 RepID=UPI000269CE9D|nr:hypothetical protein [Frankia sp. QA3]EIV96220.1 hypothetical protein FraQA3DRAFT_6090 [Frankia sp. QA3]